MASPKPGALTLSVLLTLLKAVRTITEHLLGIWH